MVHIPITHFAYRWNLSNRKTGGEQVYAGRIPYCCCGCRQRVEHTSDLYATEVCRDKVLAAWDAWVAAGAPRTPRR